MSTPNISIEGTANFSDNTVNNGVISSAVFTDSAVNSPAGSIETATFSLSSINQGAITSVATFNDTAVNSLSGTVAAATFNSNAVNEGSVTQSATFNDTAANAPTASVAVATFNDGAVNQGTISLSAFFNDTAVNSSTASVAVAVFTADTINEGVVTGNAVFEGNASNSGSGVIQGDAIFADTTSNLGTVSGTAQVSLSATNSGTVSGGATTYEHLYQYDNYYADDSTLANGTILYTGQYTRTLAINVSFSITGYTVTTNGSGLATLTPASNWYDDSSSAARALTYNGTITQSDEGSGVIAADFNGGNNYITTVATGSEFDFTSGDVTIEFWFKPASTAFQYLLLGIGTLAVHLWPGNQMTVNDGSYPDDYFGISLDVWQHFAVVISSGSRYVYLNGSLVATSTQLLGVTTTLYIGSANGYNNSANYNGKIAGLRIVKGSAIYTSDFEVPATVLTNVAGTELLLNFGATAVPIVAPVIVSHPQDVIDADLNGVFSITATGTDLQYQWEASADNGATWSNLDNIQNGSNTNTWNEQGQPVNDQLFRCRVSNGIDTVYSNTARISRVDWYDDTSSSAYNVLLYGTVSQEDGGGGVKAAALGSDGYLTTIINDDLGDGDFTIEGFINNDSYSSNTYLIDARLGSTWAIGWGLDGTNDGALSFYNGITNTFIKSNNAVTSSEWSHVAVVRNSGTITIYLNGTSVGAASNSINFNGTGTLTIGRRFEDLNNSFFNGSITNFRIVKGTAIYTSNFAVPTTLPTAVTGTELLMNFGATAVPTVAHGNGAYSDGFYVNGAIDSSYTNSTPQQAVDNSLWYTYASGVATAASGAYSNGYYAGGEISSAGDTSTPTNAAQDDALFYTYASGVATTASGSYSNGKYINGEIDTSYNQAIPTDEALDDGLWYTYASGIPSFAAAGIAQVSNGDWYTFDGNGGGNFANGTFQLTSDSNKWYTFDGSGGGEYASGIFQLASDSNKWYIFDGVGGGGLISAGTYYENNVFKSIDNGVGYSTSAGGIRLNVSTGLWIYTNDSLLVGSVVADGIQKAANDKWYNFVSGTATLTTISTQQALGGKWYTFDGNGGGGYASGINQATNGSWYTFDGNGGATPITWYSWYGYGHSGNSLNDPNAIYTHMSLFSMTPTLAIGTQMYTDGSNDASSTPNAAPYPVPIPLNLISGDTVYHWGSDGIIDSIVDTNPYN